MAWIMGYVIDSTSFLWLTTHPLGFVIGPLKSYTYKWMIKPISKNVFWEKGPMLSQRARGCKPKPFRISTFGECLVRGENKSILLTPMFS